MGRNPDKPARQRYLAQRKVALKQKQVANQKAKRAARSGYTDSSTIAGSSTVAEDDMLDSTVSTGSVSADATPEPDAGVTRLSRSSPGNDASVEAPSTALPLATPNITEHDLLAFQLKHFGDDTKPENFFIDYNTVWNYGEDQLYDGGEEEPADLGYYEDGTKRTITDEEIAFFRRSELEKMLIRLEEEEREEAEEAEQAAQTEEGEVAEEFEEVANLTAVDEAGIPQEDGGTPSPALVASTGKATTGRASPEELEQGKTVLENQEALLSEQHSPIPMQPAFETKTPAQAELEEMKLHQGFGHQNNPSQDRRPSGKRDLRLASRGELRRRNEHVPYAQRNKRKWEKYIQDEEDPEQGWMTGHRKLRELDEIKNESVELDY